MIRVESGSGPGLKVQVEGDSDRSCHSSVTRLVFAYMCTSHFTDRVQGSERGHIEI